MTVGLGLLTIAVVRIAAELYVRWLEHHGKDGYL
jgi:hypothetical protein